MTVMFDAQELNAVLCARPFDRLGIHPADAGGWDVKVWQPGATGVTLLAWREDNELATMEQTEEAGLFHCHLPAADINCVRYRIRVEFGQQSFIKFDPYIFGELTYRDSAHDHNSLYRKFGAHCVSEKIDGVLVEGVRFAVYAPNARAVSVVGDFNHWDGRVHPMSSHSDGVWRLFVPGAFVGQGYKFEIKAADGHVLPHKTDPYAFSIDQHPSFAARIYDDQAYDWDDAEWQQREKVNPLNQPMSIYEVHLGSWAFRDGRSLSYLELADQLVAYVKEMGFTHIELMPITEYPFDGSWGYQPVGLFAPTSRFGSPDEFKAFIDICHQAGIGVILDWVPAHFPTDGHGLAHFDGSSLFEYEDPLRGWHKDWNSLIYDYGRIHVCDYLISNALFWFEQFHIDGIRVDAVASMLYLDYAREDGEWIPNVDGGNYNYEAIAFLKRLNETIYRHYPNALTIAEESTAFPGVSKPTYTGGLGFGFKWNMGWMNDGLAYIEKDPIHRRYHHGELTFSMIYAYDEHFILPLSHDEVVHGKKSLLDKMPGDTWQRFSGLRAYMGYMFAHPGKKLNFMGNEFAQGREWDHSQSLDWHLLDVREHLGHKRLMQDLNHIYTSYPCFYEQDHQPQGFRWLAADDAQNSVLSFIRFGFEAENFVIALVNFTPVPRDGYAIGVPTAGRYKILINSDDSYYSGSDYLQYALFETREQPLHGYEQSICIDIPPLAAVSLVLDND